MEENTDSYVIDSSFILAHLFPDEKSQKVQKLFNRLKQESITLFAPYILPFEVFNGIQTAIIRKRVTPQLAKKLQEQFIRVVIRFKEVDLIEASSIAQKYLLTIYDSSYVYLAENLKIPLLTLDEKLIKLALRKN